MGKPIWEREKDEIKTNEDGFLSIFPYPQYIYMLKRVEQGNVILSDFYIIYVKFNDSTVIRSATSRYCLRLMGYAAKV